MNHPLEALSAFVDGELAGEELRDVEQHLRDCAACRELVLDLRSIHRAAAAVAPPAVPADLAGRIRTHLNAAEAPGIPASTAVPPPAADRPRQPRKFWEQTMPLAAAASVLVAVLIWRAWPERPPSQVDQGAPLIAESAVARENPTVPPAATVPATVGSTLEGKKENEPRRLQDQRKVADDQPAATGGEVEMKSLGYPAAGQAARAEGDAARDVTAQAPATVATAPAAGVVAAAAEPAAPSVLRRRAAPSPIRAEPYLLRLLDDRRMTVESGAYSCSVLVSEEDAGRIAAFIEEATNAAKVEAFGVTIPSASPEARQGLLRMVRERYRSALEARCGPLPQ